MIAPSQQLRLKVQWLAPWCLFELTWGQGQQLTAQVVCPESLFQLYQQWQRAYLGYYKSALRARVVAIGTLSDSADWHTELVQAEARLLSEFHLWLRSPALFDIRRTIAQALQPPSPITSGATGSGSISGSRVTLFLTCTPLELERLPWETWEVTTEFGSHGSLQIVRTPAVVRTASSTPIPAASAHRPKYHRSKTRILVILGDDTGLDFQSDRQAAQSLTKIAEVVFMGWQPRCQAAELKDQIAQTIADPKGWDILLFAGHSNETAITNGELAIAPGVALGISEIAPALTTALRHGLQFALFNSCSGLRIANALIDLGLSQVAIMREPIHNRVAQEFLLQFVQQLAAYVDVHTALLAACRYLKLEKHLTYPAAYLVPSLFCHPSAELFQIKPLGWQQQLKRWRPRRREALVLAGCVMVSLLTPVQDLLLNGRVLSQALYRQVTQQLPAPQTPPVVVVQIDEPSIRRAGISNPNPIDRAYLAKVIARLAALRAKVIGIDYLLDRQQPEKDPILAQTLDNILSKEPTWLIFAALPANQGGEIGVAPETGIASPLWSLQADVTALPQYLRLPAPDSDCRRSCPFAYLVAVVQQLEQAQPELPRQPTVPRPGLHNQTDLRTQVFDYLETLNQPQNLSPNPSQKQLQAAPDLAQLSQLARLRMLPITHTSEQVGQLWLRPINDFSIPPPQVYQRLSAWQILAEPTKAQQSQLARAFPQQVIVLSSGGYAEAGVWQAGTDNFPVPWAVAFWRNLLGTETDPEKATAHAQNFSGAEAKAYMISSFLRQHLVTPVPDLWLVLLAAGLGKAATLWLEQGGTASQMRQRWRLLGFAPLGYGILGLQIYISAAILLPWLLPAFMFWSYLLPVFLLRSKTTDAKL